MEKEVVQLVEMGATAAQARAALKKYGDVMQAAERIFDGGFDHITDEDDGDVEMSSNDASDMQPKSRMITPDDDDGTNEAIDEDDAEDEGMLEDFADYDSDDSMRPAAVTVSSTADPYAGIFFSKDRREEVIEVEEEPEVVFVPEANEQVTLMTQGQWMKGCPEGGEQSFLFGLYRELSEGECRCPHGCGASVTRRKQDFFSIFAEFDTYVKHLQKIVPRTCTKCRRTFCFACGEPIAVDSTKSLRSPTEDLSLFHCSNLQGVILGIGLAMLEKLFIGQSQDVPSSQGGKVTGGKRRKTETVPLQVLHDHDEDEDEDNYYPPVGQGKKAKLGVGYAGDIREDTSGQLEALMAQRANDEKLANLLSEIRVFLPSLRRPGGARTSDYLVHPTALAHLRRRFNFVSSQLLRNDSLADMSDRSVLYLELFEWLETISCHEALASMMAMPIMVVASVKTVAGKKMPTKGSPRIRERAIVYEGSSGPRELLEAIVIQASAALKGLEGPKQAESEAEMTEEQKRMTTDDKGKARDNGRTLSEENTKLLSFCQRILATAKAIDRSLGETKGDAFVQRLHASLPKIPGSSHADNPEVQAGETEEDTMRAYVKWANRVRFEYCDLTIPPSEAPAPNTDDPTPHYKFYFNNEARMLANADIPKRSLAIAKELAVLTTNLPVAWNSSIFLRVDETRVDVIKVLITGPEGTPYYNGCYLFDVFLGPSYNQSPPNVKYMTTNGGKFRFNPNLYADGKVCLSLLGTWTGPGWVAGKSTLLQVLISIQSMILCEEPYLNEPGWAQSAGTPQSRAYSANVRRMVVKTAMLGNLKNPPEPFEDVIRTHFRLKARSIMAQLDDWLAQDDGKLTDDGGYSAHKTTATGSSNGFQADVQELKSLLTQLQSGTA
ncbi:ubiquitin conjugating enzyme family protein [Laetiporus sulphureus 93-53]|uniref:Ubiquitin conjugating enzyme family protein n=1 Tax=Laetiporus sulphureus 93-53 TaxID=1314785 RepID=A0A165E931_9APHY|nr:ubiquitin conjugating enzyme family protein [Laetiporus sulphureus 93-53]KZT06502.1 ubiquitin conjugating enzyme family protein [Laetiporus sulphureus 93-53]